MVHTAEPRGVCIVRVTRQPTGLILSIVWRTDIEVLASHGEKITASMDVGIDAVRRFVEEFARVHPAK